MSTCIVCAVDINQAIAAPESGYGSERYPPAQAEHNGSIYRFCCSDHKETFQVEPEQYLTQSNHSETDG